LQPQKIAFVKRHQPNEGSRLRASLWYKLVFQQHEQNIAQQ
jgi:hypothetical protein